MLFTYNRASHTTRALDYLANCTRLNECRVFIYCDGPKDSGQIASVEACRQVVRSRARDFGAVVVAREENVGLAQSIVTGVNDLSQEFNRVIVIEDDLVVSPNFVNYMLQALDRYADDENVYQVSGYMFPVNHDDAKDCFFLPLITTWGWATWARAWQSIDWSAQDALESLKDTQLRKRFDLRDSYPYSRMLADRLNGINSSWGILFWWSVFKLGGLVLHPQESLVWNEGFDGTGTHCGLDSWTNSQKANANEWASKSSISFPSAVSTDEQAFAKICRFLKSQQYNSSPTARIWRRLRQYALSHRNP